MATDDYSKTQTCVDTGEAELLWAGWCAVDCCVSRVGTEFWHLGGSISAWYSGDGGSSGLSHAEAIELLLTIPEPVYFWSLIDLGNHFTLNEIVQVKDISQQGGQLQLLEATSPTLKYGIQPWNLWREIQNIDQYSYHDFRLRGLCRLRQIAATWTFGFEKKKVVIYNKQMLFSNLLRKTFT